MPRALLVSRRPDSSGLVVSNSPTPLESAQPFETALFFDNRIGLTHPACRILSPTARYRSKTYHQAQGNQQGTSWPSPRHNRRGLIEALAEAVYFDVSEGISAASLQRDRAGRQHRGLIEAETPRRAAAAIAGRSPRHNRRGLIEA